MFRVYCTYLQAIWYFGAARLLFEGRTAWNTTEPMPDMSPAMFVPVPFVFWMNFTSLTMFLGKEAEDMNDVTMFLGKEAEDMNDVTMFLGMEAEDMNETYDDVMMLQQRAVR
jgi:hypothetical protein